MDYRIVERGAFTVAGVRRVTSSGGGTWGIVKTDGSAERMQELYGRSFDLGVCFGFDEAGNNDYMCATEREGETEGFDTYTYPPLTWLVFAAKGAISEGVLG